MTRPTVSLIEGDGIGPEITAATVRAIAAAGGQLDWERVDAGAGAVAKHGDPLPVATLESINAVHRRGNSRDGVTADLLRCGMKVRRGLASSRLHEFTGKNPSCMVVSQPRKPGRSA